MVLQRYSSRWLGKIALFLIFLFIATAIYAPFLASSKPIAIAYDGSLYFPLFRYLFYHEFYTKYLDIFFNLLMFTLPITWIGCALAPRTWRWLLLLVGIGTQLALFLYLLFHPMHDPAFKERRNTPQQEKFSTWEQHLNSLSTYGKLNLVLRYQQEHAQYEKLKGIPGVQSTLWALNKENQKAEIARLEKIVSTASKGSNAQVHAQQALHYLLDKDNWLEKQASLIQWQIMPLIRPFHWEEDAGGSQELNKHVHFLELTRINRKDLGAALIFGTRISLVVGILAVTLSLLIGLPLGSAAGYYGGNFDIVVCRLIEIWEAMPTLFMLLTVVAIVQSKSIFLIIAIIGLFGWTSLSRYMRGEVFKQRNLSYVEACHAIGLPNRTIIFSHILPNAIPPILTLIPFDIMAAITSEAGLSFLGLGEEGSCSWGVLMDEGRSVFPYESYLLWPPAILLTILLVSIALVGDTFRDAIDPKHA